MAMVEEEKKQAVEGFSEAIDQMADIVKLLDKLSAFGIIGISSTGVHLSCEAFKQRFGLGPDVFRELKGATGSSVRCSIKYNGVEFCSWWGVPAGLRIVDSKNKDLKDADIYDVELVR